MKAPTEFIPDIKPIIPLPQSVIDRVVRRLQSVCKGNGIKIDDVKFVESKAQIYEVPARTLVRLTPLVETKTIAGKITKGEMISSPAAFQSALSSLLSEAQKDTATRKMIVDTVLARPDKGFSARDQKIMVPNMAREFVSHETCASCNGKGKNTCHSCQGKAMSTCGTCQGRRDILCPNCRGTGHIMQNGKRIPCTRCNGRMRIPCPACGARGVVPCSTCKGTSELTCARCAGTGTLSHIALVNVEGHLHFDYERQGLPLSVGKRIDAFGSRHAAQKDFLITPLPVQVIPLASKNNYDDETPPALLSEALIAIDYDVKIPHGAIEFALKDKKLSCTMLGYRGEIIETKPFLHELTRTGQTALIAASETPSKTKAGIQFAAKFRILRDVIALAVKHTDQRRALISLQKKYPFGVASEQLLLWYIAAQNALRHLTRRPRWVGMGIGLGIMAVALSFYLFSSARVTLLASFAPLNPYTIIGADLIGWLVSFAVTSFCSAGFAAHQIKSTLAGITQADENNPHNQFSGLLPLGGRNLFYAGGLSFLLTFLLYGLALAIDKLPEYKSLLSAFLA